MTDPLHQPIDYDVRSFGQHDRKWTARRMVEADVSGLRLIERGRDLVHLIPSRREISVGGSEQRSWVLESSRRVVGCICTRLRYDCVRETPHPWSRTTSDALDPSPEMPALELERAFWMQSTEIDPVRALRDVVLNAVQRNSFAEARAELAFDPGAIEPDEWLMTIHSDFSSTERYDDAIALFLRAGFYLQGYYDGDAEPYVARLNWPNRAH
ncbi:MAG: hypothetical protein ACQEVA_09595 [Myxococcota bacterium]